MSYQNYANHLEALSPVQSPSCKAKTRKQQEKLTHYPPSILSYFLSLKVNVFFVHLKLKIKKVIKVYVLSYNLFNKGSNIRSYSSGKITPQAIP